MQIDVNKGGEKLTINLDIIIHRIPCSIISLDLQDVMGSHSINIDGTLYKYKLDKNGKVLGKELLMQGNKHIDGHHEHGKMPELEYVKSEFKENQGCQLSGTFQVNKVPGNFHISSHAYGALIQQLVSQGIYNFDMGHKVVHISFGDEGHLREIKSKFDVGILNPLDNVSRALEPKKLYEYYLNVVPTTYIDIEGNSYEVNQITSNESIVEAQRMIPAIYFRYDLSPLTVIYTQHKESLFQFFVEVCAIIGGVYAVIGIIDSLLYRLMASMMKGQIEQ